MAFDERYFSTHTYQDVSFAKYSQYWWSNQFYAILARRNGKHGARLPEIGSGLSHLVGQLEGTFPVLPKGFQAILGPAFLPMRWGESIMVVVRKNPPDENTQ